MVRKIKLTFDNVAAFKRRLADPRPTLRRMGALMQAESQRSFQAQSYGGERWPARYEGQSEPFINVAGALSDVSRGRKIRDRRFDRRKALIDTGTLRGSMTFRLKGAKSVSVGSTVPYASKHLFGLESRQAVTDIARQTLSKEYRRFKRGGGSQFEAFKKLGFLHTVRELTTKIQQRPFVGLFPGLQKRLVTTVEESLTEER